MCVPKTKKECVSMCVCDNVTTKKSLSSVTHFFKGKDVCVCVSETRQDGVAARCLVCGVTVRCFGTEVQCDDDYHRLYDMTCYLMRCYAMLCYTMVPYERSISRSWG